MRRRLVKRTLFGGGDGFLGVQFSDEDTFSDARIAVVGWKRMERVDFNDAASSTDDEKRAAGVDV